MVLNLELFERLAIEASKSPRLRVAYDLRDSKEECTQRMLNVLLPGTKTPIHRHMGSSEVVICLYGSAIERFYDETGKETQIVELKAGSETPGVVVEIGRYHSLEATNELGIICGIKTGYYQPIDEKDIIR